MLACNHRSMVQTIRAAFRYSHLAVDVGTRYFSRLTLRLGLLPSPGGFKLEGLAMGHFGTRRRIVHLFQ